MGPARIYPWRKMHRSRAPSIAPGTFFVAQSWAGCITNMVRQEKPDASSGCNSRPGKGNEPPHRESSLGLMEVTTWAKRRQSDRRAVTQVKRLSLVRDYPRADGVEYSEGNSRPPLMARWSETAAGSES